MLPFLEIISDVEVRNRVEELYYKHRKLLYNIAKKRLQSADQAEDAVQDTFLCVAEKCENLDLSDDVKVKRMLIAILVNSSRTIYKNNLRKEKLITKISENENFDEYSPEDDFFNKYRVEKVTAALNSIDIKYSSVLRLQVVDGYSSKQIADILGKSDGAVRQMLHTARVKIKAILEKEEKIDE